MEKEVSHGERSKKRNTEIEKDKNPEAKDRQDDKIRKTGKKQAMLRPDIITKKSLLVGLPKNQNHTTKYLRQ